jgi:hypothetical protein
MLTIRIPGYAGLLPFLALTWLHGQPALADPQRALLLFQCYSCLILGMRQPAARSAGSSRSWVSAATPGCSC